MGIKSFFKSLGSKLVQVLGFVKRVVPDEVLDHAIDLVATAGKKFVDNAARREWVVEQLMRSFHLSESIARLVTELAVTHTKNAIVRGADKAKSL